MPIKPHKSDKWPPNVRICLYDEDMYLIEKSRYTRYDLHDNTMQVWPYDGRTVHLGMATLSTNWPVWDEESIAVVEDLIDTDLDHDGNVVFITRITEEVGQPCSQEFIWRLDIFGDFISREGKQRAELLAQEFRNNGLERYEALEKAVNQVSDEEQEAYERSPEGLSLK